MGRALCQSDSAARAVFACADDTLGFSLTDVLFEGPADALSATEVCQPALLAHAIAVLAAARAREDVPFDVALGHSLGEWTALVAADAIGLADALRLVHQRGQWMQQAAPRGVGAMSAILGLSDDAVAELCRDAAWDDVVVPATYNGDGHVVISGHALAVDRAAALARERGATGVLALQVSAPFHSPLMRAVEEPLREALDRVAIRAPRVPVASTVRPGLVTTAEQVRAVLVEQLVAPVLWSAALAKLADFGVLEVQVVGAGTALARMVKRQRPAWKVSVMTEVLP